MAGRMNVVSAGSRADDLGEVVRLQGVEAQGKQTNRRWVCVARAETKKPLESRGQTHQSMSPQSHSGAGDLELTSETPHNVANTSYVCLSPHLAPLRHDVMLRHHLRRIQFS